MKSLLTQVFLQATDTEKREKREEEALADVAPPKVISQPQMTSTSNSLLTMISRKTDVQIQKRKARNEEAIDDQKRKARNDEILADVLNLYGVRRNIASRLLPSELLAFSLVSKRVHGMIEKDLFKITRKCTYPLYESVRNAGRTTHASNPRYCTSCDAICCSQCDDTPFLVDQQGMCSLCTWQDMESACYLED